MIDIRSRYQMMHYLIMDIPYNNANEVMLKVLKENSKTNDFISAFRVLIVHYFQDLFKDVSQDDQINVVIPMMDDFTDYITPYYENYLHEIKSVLKEVIEDTDDFINNITELIGIRALIVMAASYFKITTGKKSSKIKRLLYLLNMIIVIYDRTKIDINIDTYEPVSNSLDILLNKVEEFKDNKVK